MIRIEQTTKARRKLFPTDEYCINKNGEYIYLTKVELMKIGCDLKLLGIADVMQWVAIKEQEPPFDIKILTWDSNTPDEPSRTDTLIAIEYNSKGKLYKWLENGYPTHWMHLPHV